MLLPKYYDQWADCMEDYLTRIDEDFWCPIKSGPYCANVVEDVGTATQNESIIVE